ncbi:MAG: hypothetical protein F4X66_08015 [Chloroflexi bacterium]|nr:hypothetical protein [Chloroflexota bacterium]MYE41431.1 hypothetical protein [Chloroflexota bacterium]
MARGAEVAAGACVAAGADVAAGAGASVAAGAGADVAAGAGASVAAGAGAEVGVADSPQATARTGIRNSMANRANLVIFQRKPVIYLSSVCSSSNRCNNDTARYSIFPLFLCQPTIIARKSSLC